MAPRVWKVIADYLEGPNYSVFFQEPSWMDYMKGKGEKPKGKAPDSIKKMIKEKGLSKPFPSTNPYDYSTPTDKPKELNDSPPFENNFPDYPVNPPHAEFNRGRVFSPGGALDYKYKTRNMDWTQNPNEQYPAISIDRKYGSDQINRVITGYMLSHYPLIVNEKDIEDFGSYIKTAASLNEIISKDYHYKNDEKIQRSGQCSVRRVSKDEEIEAGLLRYNVNCSGKDREVVFQFMRDKAGRKPNTYADYPVQIACSCQSFLFYGAQYYAVQGQYMYMPRFRRSLIPPTPHDQISSYRGDRANPGRGLNFRVCKHVLAAYNEVKKYTISKYYRQYPDVGPPSKIMNKEEWKRLLKFEFTKENIRKRLKTKNPKIPDFYKAKSIKKKINEWFREVWVPRSENEKIKILESLVEHPEEIFFLAIKEAYYTQGNVSDNFVNKVYELMSRVIQPENDLKPKQEITEGVPEDQQQVGEGTGMVIPDVDAILSEKVEDSFDEGLKSEIEDELNKAFPDASEEKLQELFDTVKGGIIDELAGEIKKDLDRPYESPKQERLDRRLKDITPTSLRRRIWKLIRQNGLQEISGEQ